MKLIPIDRQNVSILIFCLYKSTHINSFRNMSADDLEYNLLDLIDDVTDYTKYYPSKSTNVDILDSLISYFVVEFNDSKQKNNWLYQTNQPMINCLNPKTDPTTMARQLHNTKNPEIKYGTCKTCSKDCNPLSDQPFLSVIKSNITFIPNCSMKMSSEAKFTGFSIALERNINADRYIIKKINLSLGSFSVFRRLILDFSDKPLWRKLCDNLLSSQSIIDSNYNSPDCKINLSLIDDEESINGSLAELIKRGYYPLIKYKKPQISDNFEQSPIVNCILDMKIIVETSCNPFYFENIRDLHSNHYPKFDFMRLSDKKYVSEVSWRCLSCTASMSSLERLSSELSVSNSDNLDGLMFGSISDSGLEYLNFEFNVDPIRFWMC